MLAPAPSSSPASSPALRGPGFSRVERVRSWRRPGGSYRSIPTSWEEDERLAALSAAQLRIFTWLFKASGAMLWIPIAGSDGARALRVSERTWFRAVHELCCRGLLDIQGGGGAHCNVNRYRARALTGEYRPRSQPHPVAYVGEGEPRLPDAPPPLPEAPAPAVELAPASAPSPEAPVPGWWSRLVRAAARSDWRPGAVQRADERLRALSPVELGRLRHGAEALAVPEDAPAPPQEGELAPAWWSALLAALAAESGDAAPTARHAAIYRDTDAEGRRWLLEAYLGGLPSPGLRSADPLERAGAVLGAFFRRWGIERDPTRREVGQALAVVEHSGDRLELLLRRAMADCETAVASSGRAPRTFGYLWMHLQHADAVPRWTGPPAELPPPDDDPA